MLPWRWQRLWALGCGVSSTSCRCQQRQQGTQGEAEQGASPARSREAWNAALEASKAARAILGAEFVDHYVRTRDWEVRAYEAVPSLIGNSSVTSRSSG